MWVGNVVHMHMHISAVTCMFVFAGGGFIGFLVAASEAWVAGRQAVHRYHVLATAELRSGASVKAGVESEPETPEEERVWNPYLDPVK